jgi:hypothetical protein
MPTPYYTSTPGITRAPVPVTAQDKNSQTRIIKANIRDTWKAGII